MFGSKLERAIDEECESGSYTHDGECCLQCPPGDGVLKECGATQTECGQCLDSEYNYTYTQTVLTPTCIWAMTQTEVFMHMHFMYS